MIDPFRLSTAGARGEEIQARMAAEFERARSTKAPLACIAIAIDRLERLEDDGARAAVQDAVLELARKDPKLAHSIGWRSGELSLHLVPGLTPKDEQLLARALVDAARKLRIEHGGRAHRATLSIGLAHSQQKASFAFESLLAVAEEGLRVARSAGGDRWVHSELYELFETRLAHERAAPAPRDEIVPAEPKRELQEVWMPRPEPAIAAAAARPSPATLPSASQAFVDKVRQVVTSLGPDSPRAAMLEEELAAMTGEARPGAAAEGALPTEILERRIAKLLHALELAEEEITRLRRAHGIVDGGIPSIYRTVQGLSPGDTFAEIKRELMTRIFEANLALREHSLAGR